VIDTYGKELILDLHDCNKVDVDIEAFCVELAELVDMQVEDFHIWESTPDEPKDPNTWGQSAIQFILTSNITVHILPLKKAVYINLFSCKDFDADIAIKFCTNYFEAIQHYRTVVGRR
jgi:S-adenosylmethionine/arginine decarboxylase-like enzyme